ncbi:hypothetical protein [uncultured Paraglaciecola sp.]|uniref:hypothetical protein n=1 Tax=uncultured Paraglaciecola sp. TaxID=1765024 RepID=UPI0026018493|nr:hypothetical protein [uncultured Paraglaciecola sp.]
MFKKLEAAMRKDLVKMLEQSDDKKALDFAKELKVAGMFTEATEDEIERFMELV